jgi:hypothetical protein
MPGSKQASVFSDPMERAGNGFDVTRRGIAEIAPNSKRSDSPGRFAQAHDAIGRGEPRSRHLTTEHHEL